MKWSEWTRPKTKSNDLICTARMHKLDLLLGIEIMAENLILITISNKSIFNLTLVTFTNFTDPRFF